MPFISLYHNIWSCSSCNFKDQTISGPFLVEPKYGVARSLIEERWCNECQGIRRCFIGIGYKYKPGDEPNSKITKYDFKNINELKQAISKIDKDKKSNRFFPSKEKKTIKKLKSLLSIYEESHNICNNLTTQAKNFYEEIKPYPKCLKCGSTHISTIGWENDFHSCGGKFIKNELRAGSVDSYHHVVYDENGNSKTTLEDFTF